MSILPCLSFLMTISIKMVVERLKTAYSACMSMSTTLKLSQLPPKPSFSSRSNYFCLTFLCEESTAEFIGVLVLNDIKTTETIASVVELCVLCE